MTKLLIKRLQNNVQIVNFFVNFDINTDTGEVYILAERYKVYMLVMAATISRAQINLH